jgi:hypothetical protein
MINEKLKIFKEVKPNEWKVQRYYNEESRYAGEKITAFDWAPIDSGLRLMIGT